MMKKLLSLLLVLAMVLAVVPAQSLAASGQGYLELVTAEEVQMEYQSETTVIPAGPTLAEGDHERWIDRIAALPAYAGSFYRWLEANSGPEGALADPSKGTLRKGYYVHEVAVVTGSVDYTYGTGDDPASKAKDAAMAHGNEAFGVVMAYAVDTYSAFHRDHPEVFWLRGNSSYTWSMSYNYDYSGGTGTANYTMKVYFYLKNDSFDVRTEQYRDLAVIQAAIAQREADVQRILAGVPTDDTVVEQIRYLNHVLTTTNAYNLTADAAVSLDPWNCISALSGGEGSNGPVCEGYSKAFKVLCDRLGIGCVLVEGDARSKASQIPSAHMWNYVQVGLEWYAVDVTWNDPAASTSGDPALSGYETEDWLLLGADAQVDEGMGFLQSHPVTNVVTVHGLDFSNGPVLASGQWSLPANYMDISLYRSSGSYTAPVLEGSIFSGWFQDPELTKPVSADDVTGWAYAKFVDESVLTVKYQLTAGTSGQSESTDLRLLTAVDDLSYAEVSFVAEIAGATATINCQQVYQQVKASGTLIPSASAVFGEDANYFVTYTMLGVPQALFETEFTVTPCWRTLDGTRVEGTVRSFCVADGY